MPFVAPEISVKPDPVGELCHCQVGENTELAVRVTDAPIQTDTLPPVIETVAAATVICKPPLAHVVLPAHAGAPDGDTAHAYEILEVLPVGE